MSIKQRLKNVPLLYNLLLAILNRIDYFNIRFRYTFPKYKLTDVWKKRIAMVQSCPDNAHIHHVPEAGKIFSDYQLMHNGLKIVLGSYYDFGNAVLLRENKGVHEPQEEFVFQEVLGTIHAGSTMIELGSYWSFYSMWFASLVRDAHCFMVEPDPHKLNFGKLNFRLNAMPGVFELGFVDNTVDLRKRIPRLTVDALVDRYQIQFIDILHSDIQGYERQMLDGAQETFKNKKIGYVFISTHSNDIHKSCRAFLESNNFIVLCSANLDESFSWDGLLVARRQDYPGLSQVEISKRSGSNTGQPK